MHNSPVNCNLVHFQLWTKGYHESPNFETFKCRGENLPISSCHFSNHKSVFLQILHDSSLSWKITPLYCFGSKFKVQSANFRDFECLDQNSPNSCYFWSKSVFLQIFCHTSIPWDITPLYLFSWNFIYFQQKESTKVQISPEQLKVWNFALWWAPFVKII